MRETRRTQSNPRERSSSTKIFLQSLTRARVREKQEDPPHLERSVLKIGTLHLGSRTERTPKAKIKSCPFCIFMIETSFTLFFLKKTTQKIAIFGDIFFSKKRWILTFSLRGDVDLAQILRIRPKIAWKKQKCRSKNSTQNQKNRKNQNFQNFFLYLFLPQKNYFKYRNARSHRPVLETEERIQKFVDTEENEPTKVEKKIHQFFITVSSLFFCLYVFSWKKTHKLHATSLWLSLWGLFWLSSYGKTAYEWWFSSLVFDIKSLLPREQNHQP